MPFKYFPILLLFFSTTAFSNSILKIKIEKGEKVEETFSAELKEGSLHLLFVKKRKLSFVELRTFYVNSQDEVFEMEKVYYDEVPAVLSFHQNKGNIFLFTFLEKELTKIKFNPSTGNMEKEEVQGIKRPNYVLRDKSRTIFVRTDKENDIITLSRFSDSLKPESKQVMVEKKGNGKSHWIFDAFISPVNTGEFVEKGAITEGKIYLNKDVLVATYLDDKTLNYHSWNLATGASLKGVFETPSQSASKNVNSFVFAGHIYRIDSEKERLKISILDMSNGEIKKTLGSETDLEFLFTDADKKSKYFKEIRKKSFLPTITVNEGIDGNPILRLASANTTTYSYYHDWWFHHFMFEHQMQMQMMQQQAIQSIPKFNPNPEYYELMGVVYQQNDGDLFYDFALDSNWNPIPNGNLETKHQKIDKDKYLKPFKDNTYLKHLTAAFSNSKMRYIFYDKSIKTVFLNYKHM